MGRRQFPDGVADLDEVGWKRHIFVLCGVHRVRSCPALCSSSMINISERPYRLCLKHDLS
jgi:hypothetical protein